jgi:predicted nucleotidyltransferase
VGGKVLSPNGIDQISGNGLAEKECVICMKIVKIKELPKEMLASQNRKIMWKNTRMLLRKLEKTFHISNVYICGSFLTKKKWPNDVDLIVLLQMEDAKKERWSADIEFVSTPEQAQEILKAIEKYTKKRYGSQNARIFELEMKWQSCKETDTN